MLGEASAQNLERGNYYVVGRNGLGVDPYESYLRTRYGEPAAALEPVVVNLELDLFNQAYQLGGGPGLNWSCSE